MDELDYLKSELAGGVDAEAVQKIIAYMERVRVYGFGCVTVGFKNGVASTVSISMTRKLRGDEGVKDVVGYIELAREQGWGNVRIAFKNGRVDEVGVELDKKVG